MTEGIAASSSMETPTGDLSRAGAISLRKIATPIATGTEKSMARNVEMTEPAMAANPPNFSRFGAHLSSVIKSKPKAWIASIECWTSTVKIQATMSNTASAINRVALAKSLSISEVKRFLFRGAGTAPPGLARPFMMCAIIGEECYKSITNTRKTACGRPHSGSFA